MENNPYILLCNFFVAKSLQKKMEFGVFVVCHFFQACSQIGQDRVRVGGAAPCEQGICNLGKAGSPSDIQLVLRIGN